MKRIRIITLCLGLALITLLIAGIGTAHAQRVSTGTEVTVPVGETVDSLLIASGNTIDIAGTVNGDLYCAGQNVILSGTVHGDVFCVGQALTISGTVDGSVRVGGQTITLSGHVGRSATILAQNLLVERTSHLGQDLLGAVGTAIVNGSIGRDLLVGSSNLTINNVVNRNVQGQIDRIAVGSNGRIAGNLAYTGRNDPVISSGGQISGTVVRTAPKEQTARQASSALMQAIGWLLYALIAVLIVGLMLIWIAPRFVNQATASAMASPGRTALVGLIAVIVVPIILFVLFVSVIGIPLAVLGGLLWVIAVLLSVPLAGYLLGRLLLRRSRHPAGVMILGVSILVISFVLPVLGLIMMLASYLFGIGMFVNAVSYWQPRLRLHPPELAPAPKPSKQTK